MKYFLILLLFVGCADDSTKVVRVIDGDTITILQNNQEYKVRLAEIDCPERKQPFYTQAKKLTSDLAFGKKVTIVSGGFDRYHRILAEVQLSDGKSLNQELVRSGMAWQYKQYSKNPIYGQLESEARRAKRGLWVDKEPIPPWQFRKKKPAKVR